MKDLTGYPPWAREIGALLPTVALFVVAGNVRDTYLLTVASDEGRSTNVVGFSELVTSLMHDCGVPAVRVVRVEQGVGEDAETPPGHDQPLDDGGLPTVDIPRLRTELEAYVRTFPSPALVVLDAAMTVACSDQPTPDEIALLQRLRHTVDDLPEPYPPAVFAPIIWVVDSPQDVPTWVTRDNTRARSIVVPLPTATERALLAERVLLRYSPQHGEGAIRDATDRLVDQTDGLPLRTLPQLSTLTSGQSSGLQDLDHVVRTYRFGVSESPWSQPYLRRRLKDLVESEQGDTLGGRIIGQRAAIRKSVDVLIRGAVGLQSAHRAQASTRPKGVLFFAGPTGVGKTELAKGLAELLFGDESSMIRFDMSEFGSEQSADRLVGAPPGYVGFAQGGELTNAVRRRPFSVLLFDEIEKAHHRVLDRFLQILDDGRLTDARGETTYFTESIIVFTSNLGLYNEIRHPDSGLLISREPAVSPDADYDTVSSVVAARVREHFTTVLGRPELLNRIGDSIVVFGFISPEDGARIVLGEKGSAKPGGMVGRIADRLLRQHGAELKLTPLAEQDLVEACVGAETLAMGGRGIANRLESVLVDPLARWVFTRDRPPGVVEIKRIREESGQWLLQM
jgi:hypothetical protein